MSGNFLIFDLTIKFVLLHALLAVSMPNIRLVQRAGLADLLGMVGFQSVSECPKLGSD